MYIERDASTGFTAKPEPIDADGVLKTAVCAVAAHDAQGGQRSAIHGLGEGAASVPDVSNTNGGHDSHNPDLAWTTQDTGGTDAFDTNREDGTPADNRTLDPVYAKLQTEGVSHKTIDAIKLSPNSENVALAVQHNLSTARTDRVEMLQDISGRSSASTATVGKKRKDVDAMSQPALKRYIAPPFTVIWPMLKYIHTFRRRAQSTAIGTAVTTGRS